MVECRIGPVPSLQTLRSELMFRLVVVWIVVFLASSWSQQAGAQSRARELAHALVKNAETGAFLGVGECSAHHAVSYKPHLRLVLLSDQRALSPGQTFRLAVMFNLAPSWHLYYGPNPGSIGLPTKINWRLPAGFESSPFRWPAPVLYLEPTGEYSNVYEEELILVSTLTAPQDLAIGSTVSVGADFDYQLCSDRCIRGKASLELNFPVVLDGLPPERLWSHPFERAAAREPATSIQGLRFEHAFSHQPLRPADQRHLVLSWSVDEGMEMSPGRADGHRPAVVLDRIPGIGLTLLNPSKTDRSMIAQVAIHIDEDAIVKKDERIEGVFQGELITSEERRPFSLRFSAPFEGAPKDASVTALEHPLLATLSEDQSSTASAATLNRPAALPLWQALLLAFLGGLILNIMPCVLPVLSLKALAFVEEAGSSSRKVKSLVGSYVMGVLVSFWALAAVIITLKLSGEYVGWGFQFQQPSYVLVMTAVIFGFSLSMFGVFELPGISISGSSSGLKGSFVHGVLTTALSTPCSAPFLGSALAFALSQSPVIILAIFTTIGLGLATPIAVITLIPRMRRFVPKPGAWMETFKHIIAFLLVGTAIYLLTVLTAQLSYKSFNTVLIFLGLLSAALWALGRWATPFSSLRSKLGAWLATAILLGGGVYALELEARGVGQESLATERIDWRAFEGDASIDLVAQGHTVFLDFTADWCPTCKANEAVAIETDEVAALIRELGVIPIKADMTLDNPVASRWVEHYGRVAIPLNVVIPAGRIQDAIVLPEVLTEGMMLNALRQAGPSKPR